MVFQKSTTQVLKRKNRIVSRNVVKPTKTKVVVLKNEIQQYFDNNGYLSWSSKKKMFIILGTNSPKNGLVQCPKCKIGKLMVVKSYKTKKRFLGCSNYYNGCKASAPLLQKAKLRVTKIPCRFCSWPIMIFRYSRKQRWTRQCSNSGCQSRNLKV